MEGILNCSNSEKKFRGGKKRREQLGKAIGYEK